MAAAVDIHSTAFKHGSAILLARVVGEDGAHIVQQDIASAKYSVYLLDEKDPDSRTPVEGHTDVDLGVAELIFDTLQQDALWTVDSEGYNFRHVLDVSEKQAFTIAGRQFLAEFTLTPAEGQAILVRFRIRVI